MIFIAHITSNRLEVKNISNVTIKKPTLFNNKKHFVLTCFGIVGVCVLIFILLFIF